MSVRWTIFMNFIKETEKLLLTFPEGMFFDMDFYLDGLGGSRYKIQTLGYPHQLRVYEYGTGNYYHIKDGNMVQVQTGIGRSIE